METAQHNVRSVLKDSLFWNSITGVDLRYTRNTTLDNLQIVENSAPTLGFGVNMNTVTRDIIYRNLTVIGYARGIVVPRRGYNVIEGGTFNNVRDIYIHSGLSINRTVLVTGQTTAPQITMVASYNQLDGNISQYFAPDSVILNFGPFVNQRAFFRLQHPDAIPFPGEQPGVPSGYVGLTSQQLWDQYGIAVGGELAPANAISSPLVSGGLFVP
jgi:hypothetical protein